MSGMSPLFLENLSIGHSFSYRNCGPHLTISGKANIVMLGMIPFQLIIKVQAGAKRIRVGVGSG
jgi:hypothetical protein